MFVFFVGETLEFNALAIDEFHFIFKKASKWK